MGKFFMNLDDGDIGFAFDEFGINPKGEELMHLSGNMVQNLNTGEIHFVDSWNDEPDNQYGDDSDF